MTGESGCDEPRDSLPTDVAFDLLSDSDRRCALAALRATDGSAELSDLAVATVARTEDIHASDVTKDQRERTAAMLHHSHLPRLADANVLTYEPTESIVELTDVAAELDPYFEAMQTAEPGE